jgi:hypothetical protein
MKNKNADLFVVEESHNADILILIHCRLLAVLYQRLHCSEAARQVIDARAN